MRAAGNSIASVLYLEPVGLRLRKGLACGGGGYTDEVTIDRGRGIVVLVAVLAPLFCVRV